MVPSPFNEASVSSINSPVNLGYSSTGEVLSASSSVSNTSRCLIIHSNGLTSGFIIAILVSLTLAFLFGLLAVGPIQS